MNKPVMIDAFCGAGGCTKGYQQAGFYVVGVDNRPQPRYCGDEFIQADAIEVLADRAFMARFDAVHASPPCQSETDLRHRTGVEYEDLLTPTLALLADSDVPWVVENVDSTRKLPGALMLCGTAFGLGADCVDGISRPLRRHRLFASNVFMMSPGCACNGREPVGVYGTGGGGPMTRGYKANLTEARQALGIDWMNRAEISQAIPPRYTRFIGDELMAHLAASPAAARAAEEGR